MKKKREKREDKTKEEVKRTDKRQDEKEERRNYDFLKNVARPSNPPDELAQNVSNKNPFRTNYSSIFLRKFRI